MVPKLRFAEFSESWIKDKISSFIKDGFIIGHLDGNHGALYPRSEEFSQNGVPYISATDFSSGEVDFNSCKYLPISRANKFKKGISKSGDVLFAHNATVGPVSLLNTNHDFVILSTTATYFRCDTNKLNNVFLKSSLESEHFVKQYSSIMSQSTRNQVPITAQRDLIISVPDIREQNKIADFLSSVDEKITLLNKQYDLLCQYKKGMMQKIFSQEVRFKDEYGEDFPVWNHKILGDICRIRTGKLDANAMVVGGKYRFYTCAREFYQIDEYAFDTEALLISGNGANVGYIHYYSGKFNAYQRTYVLDGFNHNIAYVKYFLDMYLNERIYGEKKEGNTPYIVMGTLADMQIKLPIIKEQTKIANFLSALDDKIAVTKAELDKLKTWKQGLLQQMFV